MRYYAIIMLKDGQTQKKTLRLIIVLSGFAVLAGFFYYYFYLKDIFGTVIFVFLHPFLLFLPRLIYALSFVRQRYNQKLLANLELLAAAVYTFSTAGTIYFYNIALFEYDSLVHFLDSLIFVIIAAWLYLLVKEWASQKRAERIKFDAILAGFVLVVVGGVLWEVFQNTMDNIFSTKMFFDSDQRIDKDVKDDIASDVLGAFIGALILYFQKEKWFSQIKNIAESGKI